MRVSARAWAWVAFLALGGMVGCRSAQPLVIVPDDKVIDAVWLRLNRGDLEAAEERAAHIEDPVFRERAQRDIQASREGRAAALWSALEQGSWMAARFDASQARAAERLDGLRRELQRGGEPVPTAVWLELSRRAADVRRRLAGAAAASGRAPGGVEAAALRIETWMATGRWQRLEREWGAIEDQADAEPFARLRLARRRGDAGRGRWRAAADGLLQDLADDMAGPASLVLLERILLSRPDRDVEQRARAALAQVTPTGPRMARAHGRLTAILRARAGDHGGAVTALEGIHPRDPVEDRALRRWRERVGRDPAGGDDGLGPAGPTLEDRVESDVARLDGRPLLLRRVADEWSLAARASYREAAEQGEFTGLDAFLGALDAAAATLPGAPTLSDVPRRDYGIFGEMLVTDALGEELDGGLVVGGKALGMTADLTWYDVERSTRVPLPQPDDPDFSYTEFLVRRPRVPGFVVSRGGNITGAGIDRVVYLDLDQVEREERFSRSELEGPSLPAMSAVGRLQRQALEEPLDTAARLEQAARRAAGGDEAYEALLLESLALHERQHIRDFQEFMRSGMGGKLMLLVRGGVVPATLRARIERRAQLAALQQAGDPRIPLAQAVAFMPVEGVRRGSEHAVGYRDLLALFLQALDGGAAGSLESLGLRRDGVLLQQLDALSPEQIRTVALSIDEPL